MKGDMVWLLVRVVVGVAIVVGILAVALLDGGP